jgi:integrase
VKNPADGIEMPQAEVQREVRILTDDEVEKLAAEVPPRYRALVYMLADTGARPGEVIALRVKNLNGSVRIAESTVEVKGRKITGTPKTKGSIRNAPISPRLRAALREHYDAGYANRFDPECFVFTSEHGVQVSQSNLRNRVLVPAAERVGIDGFTTYDLRHTAISLWLLRGLTPWEVSKMVGHTTVGMIEQRYGHLYEGELQRKIDGLVTPAEIQSS